MRTWSKTKAILVGPKPVSSLMRIAGRRLAALARRGVSLKQAMSPNPKIQERLRLWRELLQGAWIHARRGETPRSAHVALVELFIASGGRANDILAKAVGIAH